MGSITHYSHFFLLGYLPGALALPLNTCHYCHCHYLTEQFFVCHKVAILLLLRYSFLCHVQWYFWKKIFVCSASRYYLSLAPRKTILFVLCNIFFFAFLILQNYFFVYSQQRYFLWQVHNLFPADLHITIFMCTNICLCLSCAYLLGSLHIFFWTYPFPTFARS